MAALDPEASLSRDEILAWLREDDPARLEQLWRAADEPGVATSATPCTCAA